MSRRQLMLPGSVILAAWLAAGCSQLPTAPLLDGDGSSQISTDRTAPTMAANRPSPPQAPAVSNSVTVQVLGNRGGTVTYGQFTVQIPAGAFSGQAMVTVSQPNLAEPRVDLSIWPASKNAFQVPVTLIATLSKVTPAQVAGSQVHELDPASGGWMSVSGQSADVSAKSVRAPLAHFSSYRVEIPAPSRSKPWSPPTAGR